MADEIELRVMALEVALTELVAWLPRGAVEDALAGLRDIPDTAGGDERTVRLQAASLLADGLQRFNGISNATGG